MTNTDKIKALIIATSAYYREQLDDHVVEMWAEDLSDIAAERLAEVIRQIRRDASVVRLPQPAKLRAMCFPEVSDDAVADQVVMSLMKALAKHGVKWSEGYYGGSSGRVYDGSSGYRYHSFDDALRSETGELGQAVVKQWGGWRRIAEYMRDTDKGVVISQLRRFVKSIMDQSRAGTLGELPQLPTAERPALKAGMSSSAEILDALQITGKREP